MTRRSGLLLASGLAVAGNLVMVALAAGDARARCPGPDCAADWTNIVMFGGLALAFAVVAVMVWRGRIQ